MKAAQVELRRRSLILAAKYGQIEIYMGFEQ
jgi:hypothetical protein